MIDLIGRLAYVAAGAVVTLASVVATSSPEPDDAAPRIAVSPRRHVMCSTPPPSTTSPTASEKADEADEADEAEAPPASPLFTPSLEMDAVNAALVELGKPGEVKSVDCSEAPCIVYATVTAPRLEWQRLAATRAFAPYAHHTYFEGGQMIVDDQYVEHGEETFAVAFMTSSGGFEHVRARVADGLAAFDPR